jgi:ADP-ribose pyrophosphatase YjhB (NUDIX family)
VLGYAKQELKLPIDITVQPQARATDVPLALGFQDGRCKLVLSMRGNPNAEDILDNVPPAQRPLMIEAMVAHEIGHCWRYVQGAWHALPAGFEERQQQQEAAALRDTRREEGYADLVALAWTQHRHPEHYATVAAWMRQVRQPSPATGSHSTLAWLELAPTGAAFPVSLPVFEQASRLWRQGLLRDD